MDFKAVVVFFCIFIFVDCSVWRRNEAGRSNLRKLIEKLEERMEGEENKNECPPECLNPPPPPQTRLFRRNGDEKKCPPECRPPPPCNCPLDENNRCPQNCLPPPPPPPCKCLLANGECPETCPTPRPTKPPTKQTRRHFIRAGGSSSDLECECEDENGTCITCPDSEVSDENDKRELVEVIRELNKLLREYNR